MSCPGPRLRGGTGWKAIRHLCGGPGVPRCAQQTHQRSTSRYVESDGASGQESPDELPDDNFKVEAIVVMERRNGAMSWRVCWAGFNKSQEPWVRRTRGATGNLLQPQSPFVVVIAHRYSYYSFTGSFTSSAKPSRGKRPWTPEEHCSGNWPQRTRHNEQ